MIMTAHVQLRMEEHSQRHWILCIAIDMKYSAFAKESFDLGINYLGVCCGATPMHIREVAEATGLTVPASKYRENMSNHFMYGDSERIAEHMQEFGDKA